MGCTCRYAKVIKTKETRLENLNSSFESMFFTQFVKLCLLLTNLLYQSLLYIYKRSSFLSRNDHVRFFCLQVCEHYLKTRYGTINELYKDFETVVVDECVKYFVT